MLLTSHMFPPDTAATIYSKIRRLVCDKHYSTFARLIFSTGFVSQSVCYPLPNNPLLGDEKSQIFFCKTTVLSNVFGANYNLKS